MNKTRPIILASGSSIRAKILRDCGVNFSVIKPDVDESRIKTLSREVGASLEETAIALADAKCMAVAESRTGLVIGSDQILEFENRAYDKPLDMAEAHERLLEIQGKSHTLINAQSLARDGEIIWRHLERPKLTMHPLTRSEVDAYLEEAGPEILSSVGAYQVEGLGGRLFESISGDYFAVLGLALFPLLGALRGEGALKF